MGHLVACSSGSANIQGKQRDASLLKEVNSRTTEAALVCVSESEDHWLEAAHTLVSVPADISKCLSHRQIPSSRVNPYRHMKNGVFWDVTPCGCCKNRRFGGT
jgi:hypothetical protein